MKRNYLRRMTEDFYRYMERRNDFYIKGKNGGLKIQLIQGGEGTKSRKLHLKPERIFKRKIYHVIAVFCSEPTNYKIPKMIFYYYGI